MEHKPLSTCTWEFASWPVSESYLKEVTNCISTQLGLTSESKCVDLGCGRAAVTRELAKKFLFKDPIIGVEPSVILEEAQSHPHLALVREDAYDFLRQQQSASFNAFILKQMIHLIEEPLRFDTLKEIFRALRPQGRVIILIMPPRITIPTFPRSAEEFERGQIDYRDVAKLCQLAGFTVSTDIFKYHVKIAKADYYKAHRMRFMSHLLALTNAEIEDGIRIMDKNYRGANLEFDDELHLIVGTKTLAS